MSRTQLAGLILLALTACGKAERHENAGHDPVSASSTVAQRLRSLVEVPVHVGSTPLG